MTTRAEDELKPVTALFADVVGSTPLGELLPPDEVKLLVGDCVSRMAEAVEYYGGVVQAYMGDGICAYFGVPQANEDDPERAAMAALRITASVRELAASASLRWNISDLSVRIGINTGQTAVGFVGASDPKAVALGDTTNTAARIQSAAPPGHILLGRQTAELLQRRFDVAEAGEVELKGKSAPVRVWRLVAPNAGTDDHAPIPLVGRESELALVEEALRGLRRGRGSVVTIFGERGIGKTRLLRELSARAADVTVLGGRCHSYGGRSAYGPIVEMLSRWVGVRTGDEPTAVRTKMRAALDRNAGPVDEEMVAHLAASLGAPFEGTEGSGSSPGDAFVWWVRAVAGRAPVAVVVDDAHWADPATHDLLDQLLEVTDQVALSLVVTLRLDVDTPARAFRARALSDFAHRVTDVSLEPLNETSAMQLADALAPEIALDGEARATIVRMAEGNPLYLEELMQALIEGGRLVRERSWTLVGGDQMLPPALESLLVARIDRLPAEARRAAQLAAVLGREFSLEGLRAVGESTDVQADLAVLMRAGVVEASTDRPRPGYTFRHGLVHEAALSTLTPARRKALYTRVGRAHETLFEDTIDDHLEELAFYYYRSDDLDRAQHFLQEAAARTEALSGPAAAAPLWRRLHHTAAQRGDDEVALGAQRHLERSGLPLEISQAPPDPLAEPGLELDVLEASERIGDYSVVETIGEGATGVVYRAVGRDGAEVALKVLKQELARDETFRKRFAHEARAAGDVTNDHLVGLIASGEAEGRLYIAMQYVRGATLRDRLDDGPLQPLATARIVRQIASALDALHAAGIVHRDLKPANIIVGDDQRVTLTDLGLAKGRAYTVLTKPGQLLGTLDYMAPELIKGETATPASDVYSLAALAFECLVGRAPFADLPVLQVGLAHMSKEPPNLCEIDPSIPRDVGWTVAQALAKDPPARPPSAGAFANMLRLAVGR